MERGVKRRLSQAHERVGMLAAQLESLSPLAVLGRGYSVTQRADNGEIVRAASTLALGDFIRTRLGTGSVISLVEIVEESR